MMSQLTRTLLMRTHCAQGFHDLILQLACILYGLFSTLAQIEPQFPHVLTTIKTRQDILQYDHGNLQHRRVFRCHLSLTEMDFLFYARFPRKRSRFFLQLDFMTEGPDIRLTGLYSCKDTFQKPQLTLSRVRQALTNKITECQRVRGGDVCQSCRLIWAEYLRMQTTHSVSPEE